MFECKGCVAKDSEIAWLRQELRTTQAALIRVKGYGELADALEPDVPATSVPPRYDDGGHPEPVDWATQEFARAEAEAKRASPTGQIIPDFPP